MCGLFCFVFLSGYGIFSCSSFCVPVCCVLQSRFCDWQRIPSIVLRPCFAVQFPVPWKRGCPFWRGLHHRALWVLLSLYFVSFGKMVTPWWQRSTFYSYARHLCWARRGFLMETGPQTWRSDLLLKVWPPEFKLKWIWYSSLPVRFASEVLSGFHHLLWWKLLCTADSSPRLKVMNTFWPQEHIHISIVLLTTGSLRLFGLYDCGFRQD